MLPGTVFGRPSRELIVRIAYVDFDGARALEALCAEKSGPLDEGFLRAYCTPVVDGITRLCEWLER